MSRKFSARIEGTNDALPCKLPKVDGNAAKAGSLGMAVGVASKSMIVCGVDKGAAKSCPTCRDGEGVLQLPYLKELDIL